MQRAPEECQSEINKMFNKFSTFVAKIKQNFEDLNKVWKTIHTIMTIQQKTSVATYTTEFQQAAAYLSDWSDKSLIEHYWQELKNKIKNRLIIYKNLKDLNVLINLTIKIDNHLFECWYQANTPQQTNQQHTENEGDAMKLDSTNWKNSQKNKSKQFNKKFWEPNPNWTKKQKKCYKQKLYIHYKKNNHME